MPVTMYMDNLGGIDVTSSPLSIKDNQATGQSFNYDYARTGAITKVLSPTTLNSSPDTQLKTVGIGVHHNASTDLRTVVRAAGTKIQVFDPSTGIATNQTDDTVTAGTDFLDSNSTNPVVFSPFNTATGGTQLWAAGGGLTNLTGYTGSQVTVNGVTPPTGSITPVVNTSASGTWAATGKYFYAIQFRKLSTQAFSNVALDVSATVANTTDSVTLPLTAVTNIDTTKYDQIWIYRSAVSGVTSFTTGSVIAKLASSVTTYEDKGTSIADSLNIPRAGNTILDNSQLASSLYKSITSYKRRLVTALDSTIYLSDLNKPESWPTVNTITIPTGGPITALGVIGVPSEYTTGADEYLCIWKENELWVLTGTNTSDWTLLFVDKTGCAGPSLVVPFNGFITWMTYSGIFIWDGRGRPSRVSKPIHGLFEVDGDLDKSKLNQGYACQFEKSNEVIWRVSHKTKGANKFSIKMDTRLTAASASENLQNTDMNGVFTFDTDSNAYYAICPYRSQTFTEVLLSGDGSGHMYQLYSSASSAVLFDYETKPLDMGHPERLKRFKRVLVYLEKLTNNDLTVLYWVDFRNRDEYKSKIKVSMAPVKGTEPALYDVGRWDEASWDDYTPDISPLEFNLHSYENNAEGLSLKLRFEQLEASAPVRIHGFAIDWEDANPLPIPSSQV